MDKLKQAAKFFLAALIAAQVLFPVYMIVSNEITLAKGNDYLFRVAPYDPYDPFRGRYVTVRIMDNEAEVKQNFNRDDTAYAELITSGGHAQILSLTAQRPAVSGYVKVKIKGVSTEKNIKTARVEYPFDRLFMNEKIAPLVDKAFRGYKGQVYLQVAIKDGQATPKKLFFDGVEASEYVKK